MRLDLHSIFSFLLTISIVVVVHELGHFLVARFFNVEVERFSIGFGKVLFKKNIGPTEFNIRAFPLGGFVQFKQAVKSKKYRTEIKKEKYKNFFEAQALPKKAMIVLAGPCINFIFAFLLLLFLSSGDQYKISPQITVVEESSIAFQKGFMKDDVILELNNQKITSVTSHLETLIKFANKDLYYKVNRNDDLINISINKVERDDLKNKNNGLNGLYFYPSRPNSIFIKEVIANSPAYKAGIKARDQLFTINDKEIFDVNQFIREVNKTSGRSLKLSIIRGQTEIEFKVTHSLLNDKLKSKKILGIKIFSSDYGKNNYLKTFKYNNLEIIYNSFYRLYDKLILIFQSIVNLVIGNIEWKHLSGPIAIAEISSNTLTLGLVSYISFLVFLNLNVGLINLLPIPTLDGGHLLFYLIEGLTKKRVNYKIMIISQRLGVIILVLIFTIAVYNDIFKLFGTQ